MILASRLLLVAILVSWQAFPALAYTHWIELPSWSKSANTLSDTDQDQATATLTDNLTDPIELLSERTNLQNGPFLALIPEPTSTLDFHSISLFFYTYHSILTGSCAFLYRDRGPPLFLLS